MIGGEGGKRGEKESSGKLLESLGKLPITLLSVCGFEELKITEHSSLRLLCLWFCRFKNHRANLAVLEDLQIRKLMYTARFVDCACRRTESEANGHSSLRSLCLWICRFKG